MKDGGSSAQHVEWCWANAVVSKNLNGAEKLES